jgi:hypothetical protein
MIDLDTELGILLFVGLFHPSELHMYVGLPPLWSERRRYVVVQHDAIQIGSK